MKVEVKNQTLEEFKAMEVLIRKSHVSIGAMQETWNSLYSFFKNSSVADDKKFYLTFFRLYTELTWKLLSALDREIVVDALRRQVPLALQLEFDVWKIIIEYLAIRTVDRSDMTMLYSSVRQAFLESNALVGKSQGRDVQVKELIAEIEKVNRLQGNSLQMAQLNSRISDIFSSIANQLPGYFGELEVVVDHFIGLVNFFLGIKADDIWYVVNTYMNPVEITKTEQVPSRKKGMEVPAASLKPIIQQSKPKEIKKSEPKKEIPQSKPVETKMFKPTYSQLRRDVNRVTSVGPNAERPAKIIAELDRLATEMGDEKIRELFYFNEQSGKFEWNEAMLRQ